ncbi:MAG: hypothetical protein M3198_12930 [Actinomycetota bacterium]|nr:hypothetical protein [Actinomycetota bacterium]
MPEWDELRRLSQTWSIPDDSLEQVQKRAKTLTWRRRVFATAVSSALLVSTGVSFALWPSPSRDQGPVVAAGSTPEGARAATFAFHALLEVADYGHPERGSYDYRGVEQTGPREWRATFLAGRDPVLLRQSIQTRLQVVEEAQSSDEQGPRIEREIARLERDILSLERQLEAVEEAGEPEILVTVRLEDPDLQVAAVEGAVTEEEREQLLTYSEEARSIQVGGHEFYRLRVRRTDDGFNVNAPYFWTGPIPSSMRERCGAVLIDDDETLTKLDGERAFVHTAPPEEDRRDGGILGSQVSVPKRLQSLSGLQATMKCEPLDAEGWVTSGEARIETPTEKMVDGNGTPLDPERHVVVEIDVVYEGDPGVESICIARVFDDSGQEVSSHGQTLYPPNERLERSTQTAEIGVDVGDPEAADYATVSCQPTVPGVLLGPDQEP